MITGGTIDSVWSGAHDTIIVSEHSVLPEYFNELKRNLKFFEEIIFTEICMKDSRQITQEDRKKMLEVIEKSETPKIIITHGTYTMPDTAKYLQEHLKRTDATVVLVGAMTPVKGFDFSDAPFNLGYAFAQLQVLLLLFLPYGM